MTKTTKPKAQMGKRPRVSAAEQSKRFIDAARKAGASEDERDFDEALKKVVKAKPKPKPKDD